MIRIALVFLGLTALVGGGIYVSSLYYENQELEKEKLQLEVRIETFETNVALLEAQLKTEREIRDNADIAVQELQQEVPDVDYNTPLPESIQGVLDRFHSSTR